ncbi:class I SAM-dependent methyltransferase [Chelatococcus daeguensis]|uniref:Class I SAM-dependent methyltransferase n=2 Tax=Chelatococcus TaxID=28209 RepID=A0AAC9JN52_9HYPH|nr:MULTISPECIES: class I SAM-dependent methyltransferase [Chelatococcus]APF36478.1 hypothetical protein BOQ54_03380 [Chelatococcus daeguensis]KZE33703.1 hypothetical protein AVW15_17800 [Chelatococcus daeguensis]MBM3082775.1 class I SAM-dependent methyltransferase [Chelatococcus daeguensis]CUA89566.1 Methyltransferase domain [Chelatococcus sambhunathii]
MMNAAPQPQTARIARACPLCGNERKRKKLQRYSDERWSVVACPICDFVHLSHAPPLKALESELAWEKSFHVERDRRRKRNPLWQALDHATRWRLRLGRAASPAGRIARSAARGAVLDLGCGTGRHLEDLPEGYTPYGVEISRELAEISDRLFRARGGRTVQASALDGLREFDDGFFSGALLRSFLEHDIRPLPILEELNRVLVPGGVALVKVPNFASINRLIMGQRWCGIRLPDHVNYFTPGTLRRMAGAAGFNVRFDLLTLVPTSDNMWATLVKPPIA